ncbi:MAG: hypothetical protein AB1758_16090 [Candidatus Eremiobacterota bacterium]
MRFVSSEGDFALPTRLLQNRDRAGALRRIRELIPQASDSLSLCRLAHLAHQAGAFRLSRRCLARANRFNPGPAVLREEVRQHRSRDDPQRAWALLRHIRAPWAARDRAWVLADMGRVGEALDEFARLDDAYAHHQRAELLRRLGRLEEARDAEEEALRREPTYLWSRWRRALDRPDPAEALAELDRAEPAELVRMLRLQFLRRLERPVELGDPRFEERFRQLDDREWEWIAFRGRERATRLTVRVASEVPVDLDRVARFLSRELPGLTVRFEPLEGAVRGTCDELELDVLRGNRLAWARALHTRVPGEEEALLVVRARPGLPGRATRGFGGNRLAVVEWDPADVHALTILPHELGHAVFGLPHTDGLRSFLDPLGLMGYPGSMVELEQAYLDPRQRCCMAAPPGRSEWVEHAWELERRGCFRAAEREYREVLRRNPWDLWVRGRLVRRTRSVAALRELRELDPGFDLAAWEAELLWQLGREEEGRTAFEAVGIDPAAVLTAGRSRMRALDLEEAEFDLRVAWGLSPGSREAPMSLACLSLTRGRYREARRLLEWCLQGRPRWGEAWRRLALLEAEQGRYREAEEWLPRGASLQEECADQAWFEGQVAWLKGDLGTAERHFERAHRRAPEEQVPLYSLAVLWLCTGRADRSRRAFRRCLESDPLSLCGRGSAAFLAWQDGDARGGLDGASWILRRVPRDAPAVFLALLGSRSARWRERLRRLEPNHPGLA